MLELYKKNANISQCFSESWFFFKNTANDKITFQVFGNNSFSELQQSTKVIPYLGTSVDNILYINDESIMVDGSGFGTYVVNQTDNSQITIPLNSNVFRNEPSFNLVIGCKGDFFIYNTLTNTTIYSELFSTIPALGVFGACVYDSVLNVVYVVRFSLNQIDVFDIGTLSYIVPIPMSGTGAYSTQIDTINRKLYIATVDNFIEVIDLNTNLQITTIAVTLNSVDVFDFNVNTDKLYIGDFNMTNTYVVNTITDVIVLTIPSFNSETIQILPNNNIIFTKNSGVNNVILIDAITNATLQTQTLDGSEIIGVGSFNLANTSTYISSRPSFVIGGSKGSLLGSVLYYLDINTLAIQESRLFPEYSISSVVSNSIDDVYFNDENTGAKIIRYNYALSNLISKSSQGNIGFTTKDFASSPIKVLCMKVDSGDRSQTLNPIKYKHKSSFGATDDKNISLSKLLYSVTPQNIVYLSEKEGTLNNVMIDGNHFFEITLNANSQIWFQIAYEQVKTRTSIIK